jgi:beta-galactosidase/beta-glucuronidase
MAVVSYGIYQFTRPVDAVAIDTPWTAAVDADVPWPEYPRPQLRRPRWQNLNGRWQYAVTSSEGQPPAQFDGTIVVPFAIESRLSGVERDLQPDERLWYSRGFTSPLLAADERLLLHFGAVDWEAEVWVNDTRLGVHRGGFDSFTFDVTDALVGAGPQRLRVAVRDPTNRGPGAHGKQDLQPSGITYSRVSGIWQTVWLEPVPATRVDRLAVVGSDIQAGSVTLRIDASGALPGDRVELRVQGTGVETVVDRVPLLAGRGEITLEIPGLRPWSPADPFLYELEVSLWRASQRLDTVDSYFGAREIRVAEDASGVPRLFLNGEPLFHLGLLDQGWWPDGLYTAPTDEALAFDIEATRRMGFNTIRKHVKVEPARWYWHADRLGVLVWQDMPTGGHGGGSKFLQVLGQLLDAMTDEDDQEKGRSLTRAPESADHFRRELAAMMTGLAPFTSVVAWVPFNEGWGQFDTDRVLAEVAARDPYRLVDGPSGWFDTGSGQMRDLHMYARESDFLERLPPGRPVVYGEFGGLGYPVAGHLAVESGWGYRAYEDAAALEAAYVELLGVIEKLLPRGLAGAIYTQTTDVESEINGLITYDRKRFKLPPEQLRAVNQRVLSDAAAGG